MRIVLIAAVSFLSSEWLFLVTKPSFLSQLDWFGKILTLILAGMAVCIFLVITLTPVRLIFGNMGRNGRAVVDSVMTVAAASIFTLLSVLLIDNFTYTLFGFGIRTITSVPAVVLYLLIASLLFLRFARLCWKRVNVRSSELNGLPFRDMTALLAAITIAGIAFAGPLTKRDDPAKTNYPNVLIASADGVEAAHMSVYGYERDTTPFLNQRMNEFLIADNSFTNNSATLGSNVSMLTGKYPAETEVIYPPNILSGTDQFEHLPGILMGLGHRTFELSVRWTGDSGDAGLRCGFHYANFRSMDNCFGYQGFSKRFAGRVSDAHFFLELIVDRVTERAAILNFAHGLRPEQEGYIRGGQPDQYWSRDHARIAEAIRLIDSHSSMPFFINMHLMGTHGPIYDTDSKTFSGDRIQQDRFEDDSYDDAILDFDSNVRKLLQALEARNILESTIVVINSDHGRGWRTNRRLPLMFRFPGSKFAGRIYENTQRLDIAPTILDYLDMEIPAYMGGESLIGRSAELGSDRVIFQTAPPKTGRAANGRFQIMEIVPPYYSIGTLQILVCQRWVKWNPRMDTWEAGTIEDHTAPCHEHVSQTNEQLLGLGKQHLLDYGYPR